MQNIILSKSNKYIKGTVNLTGSKSECNRALIIEALSNGKVKVDNVSDSADSVLLAGILRKNQEVLADGSDHGP
jgi:3-phosphoshikimate 1-carboxyvinyltransferase